ncbi:MAG: hypothetical protein ACRDH5_00865 [bacterium]
MKRLMTAGLFLGALGAFFLPFVEATFAPDAPAPALEQLGLPARAEVTFTGIDLVRAGVDAAASRSDPDEVVKAATRELLFGGKETVDSQLWTIGALAAGGVGLLLTLRQWRIGAIVATLLGAAGVGALLLAKSEIDRRAGTAQASGLALTFLYGLWTSIGLFAGTAVSGLYRLGADRKPA